MAKKQPGFFLYVKDVLTDVELQAASSSTRGVWLNALCLMWQSRDRGLLTGSFGALCRRLNATPWELARFVFEANELGFCDVEGLEASDLRQIENGILENPKASDFRQDLLFSDKNLTLVNRRMAREHKERENHRLRQRRYDQKRAREKSDGDPDGDRTFPFPIASPKTTEKHVLSNADAVRLAELLFELIRRNNPRFKKPNLDTWAADIDKAMRIDGRTADELEEVIRFAQSDDFWKPNVLSGKKLREKFDVLTMQAQRSGACASGGAKPWHI